MTLCIDTRCWEWTHCRNAYGYGVLRRDGKVKMAHRVAYEQVYGPIPEGMVIDHLCRNRGCVNPYHMEVVTRGENVRRGDNNHRKRTHCKYGHPLDGRNERQRFCLTCKRKRAREWARAHRKAAA